ncbi:MAG: SDR family oxidoreductase [Bacteroidetes bacterium]|nr:MAG: SDR family oxidoreductase [Bacteroidota bacterium]
MKILIIGSTGRVGKLLVTHALEKGHQVTAFARNVEDYPFEHENLKLFQGDVLYPALIDVAMPGHDIVLSVIGIRQFKGPITLLSTGMGHIIAAMKKHGLKRILTLTGAGILQENEHELIMDSLGFPPNLQNLSLDHRRVFHALQESGLDWTIVCPAFMTSGPKRSNLLVRANYYPSRAMNQVSAEAVADFMTDEMIKNEYIGQRVGIAEGFEDEDELFPLS